MTVPQSHWWKDPLALRQAVQVHGSPTAAARALGGISERAAQRWAKQLLNSDASSATSGAQTHNAGAVDLTVPEGQRWSDAELLEAAGLEPEEWIVTDAKPGRHEALAPEGRIVQLDRLTITARRRMDSLMGITLPEGWQPPSPAMSRPSDKPIHIPLFGDPHFPMHEPKLYDASLAWMEEHRPPRWICMGDEGDWSPFKRHKPNRRTDCSVGESVLGTFNGLAGWAALAPGDLIDGNHTRWLSSRIAEQMPALVGLKRPGDEHEMHSLNHVLKLPELGITYHEAGGEWFDSKIVLAEDLVLLHGVKTGKHGGAIAEHDGWEGTSIAQGHDHSLQFTAISKKTPTGYTQNYAISTGAMSLRDLGYSSTKDVDQGWAVITIWPDGKWHPDFALFNPQTGETTWRDWRYRP